MLGAKDSSDRSHLASAGAAVVTLLAVQIVIGYEWLSSGITKIASGTFVSGLAGDLKDKSQGAAHWYRTFLTDSIVPNAKAFAVLIEVGELIVGVALIVTAIVWLTRWSRLSDRGRMTILWTVMVAALGATFMAINFHLANDGKPPWLIPADGFDETIDVDTVLAFIQIAFFSFSGYLLLKLRGQHQAAARRADSHAALPEPS